MTKFDRTTRRARQAERAATQTLARDLATYTSAAELAELEAVLRRDDDAETDGIRLLVDWSRAA